jgi:hypothetical protein
MAREEQVDDGVGDVVVEVVDVAGDQEQRREELEQRVVQGDVGGEEPLLPIDMEQVAWSWKRFALAPLGRGRLGESWARQLRAVLFGRQNVAK